MITRVAPANPSVPRSADADKTLPPAEYFFASGNSCIVAPAMRKDRKDPEKCNIVVSYTWRRKPTQSDQDEMEREVSRIAGQPVPELHRGKDLKEAGRIRDEFLNPAKRH